MNKFTYDDSLDVKPIEAAKSTMPAYKGAKSVHQEHVHDLQKHKEDPSFNDSKSEAGALKASALSK